MKRLSFISFFMLPAIWGCDILTTKDEVKSFIPGLYARHYVDEYRDSYDTIQIQLIVTGGSEGYTVVKRSFFQKQTNDGRREPGYELKNWPAVYEEKTKTLLLEQAGKRIYFDPRKNELKIGTEPYKKLKI